MISLIRRLLAFITKEILDVMRQPRLLLVLIAGPFLILLLFGIGFTGRQSPVTTILVIPENAELPPDLRDRQWDFGTDFPIKEVTADENGALAQLGRGEVDLVAVMPRETYSILVQGRKIPITVYMNTVDPVRAQWISFGSNFFLGYINDQLAARVAAQGQGIATVLQDFATNTRADLDTFIETLDSGDAVAAADQLDLIIEETSTTADSVDSTNQLLIALITQLGVGLSPEDEAEIRNLSERLGEFRTELVAIRDGLRSLDPDVDSYRARIEEARQILNDFDSVANTVTQIPPDILIAPLELATDNISLFEPTYVGFYAPAVLALLAQHIALTFAALSLVRERTQGSIEIFQVSPVRPIEVLIGKTLGYLLLTFALTLLLTILLINVLGVPLYGNAWQFLGILLLEILASIAWGLLLSALSGRESQAVQYSMLLLLASVFFSGFFLNLSGLIPEVRWVSTLLPVTYAIRNLQTVMLTGGAANPIDMLALGGMSILLIFLAWVLFRRQSRAT
jgi:ABC-2 type transport system permease protein